MNVFVCTYVCTNEHALTSALALIICQENFYINYIPNLENYLAKYNGKSKERNYTRHQQEQLLLKLK